MTPLPPWANGPFELLNHAEEHLRKGDDIDRRIALISFDNAIEVAIATYLSLHPIQRANRTYKNEDVERWLRDYHSKLDFLDNELQSRGLGWEVERSHIVWAHDQRSEQYHGGKKGIPEKQVLECVRKTACWVFGLLFDISQPEAVLEQALLDTLPENPPERAKKYDVAIDGQFGVIDVADQQYYTSDILFGMDFTAYRVLGDRLCGEHADADVEPEE